MDVYQKVTERPFGYTVLERMSDPWLKWYIKYQFNRLGLFEALCPGWRSTRIMDDRSTRIFGPVEDNDENVEEEEEVEEEEPEE